MVVWKLRFKETLPRTQVTDSASELKKFETVRLSTLDQTALRKSINTELVCQGIECVMIRPLLPLRRYFRTPFFWRIIWRLQQNSDHHRYDGCIDTWIDLKWIDRLLFEDEPERICHIVNVYGLNHLPHSDPKKVWSSEGTFHDWDRARRNWGRDRTDVLSGRCTAVFEPYVDHVMTMIGIL